MAISDRISAMYDHVGDIYDTLELGGDTTQNKNIVNINTEIKREYKNFLAHGTDTLWNNWEKVSGTGTELSLNNTMEGKMKVDLKGNTQQNGEPTPSTPIPVQVVSGNNTIKVEGKNLFDKDIPINDTFTASIATALSNFKTTGKYAKGYINYPTLSINSDNRFQTIFINCQENTTYTMSFASNKEISALCYFDNEGNMVGYGKNYWSTFTTFTFTTPQNSKYIGIGIQTTDIETLQIEKNNQATTYTPYVSQTYPISLGNIELCKIGDYQDRIYKDNGKWYLNKQIGKVVLDGSENWQRYGAYGTPTYYLYYADNLFNGLTDIDTGRFGYGYALYFKWVYGSDLGIDYSYMRFQYGNGKRVYIAFPNDLSLADFKTWLSTHNTEVYYVLATPTTTEITDETLINQLEALAYSYEGTTNISQVNDDLPSELDVVALEDI